MSHNGQLVRDGVYQDEFGAEFILFSHIIHSETNKQYVLLIAEGYKEKPFAVSLDDFMSQQNIMYSFVRYVEIIDVSSYIEKNIKAGTYEHYKSTAQYPKIYNVLGTVEIQNGAELVIYHPLYGQQALMGRPLTPINPKYQDEGAFVQQVNSPELNYTGARFVRIGELT